MKRTGHAGLDEPFAGLFTQGMVVHETYRGPDGTWVSPAEIRIEGDARAAGPCSSRRQPVEIGSIEKMSKSKRNTVDPDDIIGTYGADTARWFMLSDSPPERDVIWTEEGVQGASRFAQRLWRLTGEIAGLAAPSGTPMPNAFGEAALAVRKASHRALIRFEEDVERLRFNRCVARDLRTRQCPQRRDRQHRHGRSPGGPRLGVPRGRRDPGAGALPDDAPSGRGMLDRAWPRHACRRSRSGQPPTGNSSSRT